MTEINPLPLPAGTFARILHDDEAKDGKQRIGDPEVWPLYWVEYSPMIEEWQWFWFRQLVYSFTNFEFWDETKLSPQDLDKLKGKWRSLTKGTEAFTNKHGTDIYRDYISNTNLSRKGLPSQGAITCCGNVVKIVGDAINKGTPIETLDGTKPPPDIAQVNRLKTPWLIFCAVNIPCKRTPRTNKCMKVKGHKIPIYVNGGKRMEADPFPQLDPLDTLVPLCSNGNKTGQQYQRDGINLCVNYIRTSRLVTVANGVVPSPYVPPP